ncbi:MAG: DHA2 family efflux MFS transporter permease subunit [Pyrinomonadaceae bacterium]
MSAEAMALEPPAEKKSFFSSHPLLMVGVLTIASFMEVLDAGIANVALPNISGSLSVTPEEASLVTSSYLVANAVIVPITGWLSTYFGRKRLYMTCVAIFIAASFLCGISTSLEMLVFFRIVQGLGGGSLVALEQAFIVDRVPEAQRGMAFSIYGVTVVAAPIFAPALGGWLTDTYSWHWVFFINVPIGLLSLFLVSTLLTEPKATTEERKRLRKSGQRIDWVGILLITIGVAALTIVLDKGNNEDWFASNFIIIFSIIAFVALVIGVTWEMTCENPAVDIRLLANRSVGGGVIVVFVIAIMIYGGSLLIPLFAQRMLGFTAQDSGLINTAGGMVSLIMIPLAGFMMKKIDSRYLAAFGLAFSAFAIWNLTGLNLEAGYWDMAVRRGIQAFGGAFLFAPVLSAAFRGVPAGKTDNASSLITAAASLGGSFGIAILTMLLVDNTQHHTRVLGGNASPYNPNYVDWLSRATQAFQDKGMSAVEAAGAARSLIWNEIQRQAELLAFIDVFYVIMAMLICAIPLVFLFKPGTKAKKTEST